MYAWKRTNKFTWNNDMLDSEVLKGCYCARPPHPFSPIERSWPLDLEQYFVYHCCRVSCVAGLLYMQVEHLWMVRFFRYLVFWCDICAQSMTIFPDSINNGIVYHQEWPNNNRKPVHALELDHIGLGSGNQLDQIGQNGDTVIAYRLHTILYIYKMNFRPTSGQVTTYNTLLA